MRMVTPLHRTRKMKKFAQAPPMSFNCQDLYRRSRAVFGPLAPLRLSTLYHGAVTFLAFRHLICCNSESPKGTTRYH
jgi:hypothetical protein